MEGLSGTASSLHPRGSGFRAAGLLIVGALLIFSPLIEGGTTHGAALVIRLMILLLLGLYWASAIRAGRLAWPRMALGLAVAAYLGLAAVSVATSPYVNQSHHWLLILLGYAALLYLLVLLLDAWSRTAALLLVVAGVGLFEAGLALVQWGWMGKVRPTGTFFNPNFLAGYLAAIACIVLAFLSYRRWNRIRRWGARGWMHAVAAAGALALLLLAIVGTGSRGGALALLAGTGIVCVLRFGRPGLFAIVLVALLGAVAPNPVRDRIVTEHLTNPVGYARWQMWEAALRQMADHPLGVGLGLYQYVYPRYAFPVDGEVARYGRMAVTPHNEYLQMGVELGPASLLAFGWGLALVVREAAAGWRTRLRRWQRGVLAGVTGGAASILVHAAVDSNLHEPAIAIVLTLCVAVILSVRRLGGRGPAALRTVPLRFRLAWAAAGALVVIVAAAQVLRIGLGWAAYEVGQRAAARQDVRGALARLGAAVAWDPGKALYRSALAAVYFRLYEQTGQVEAAKAAVEALEAAMALNPLDGRLPALLGHVSVALAMSRSEFSEAQRAAWLRAAVSLYERAAALEPFSPSYPFDLGRLYLALGERDRAEASVRHAVEVEPNFLPGREWLARLYLEIGRLEAAQLEHREILVRQQRYANRPKDPIAQRFLTADAAGLAAALQRAAWQRART
ncbi:O-antigen ligase family protein [Nitrospira sp. Kam-Ns4a]